MLGKLLKNDLKRNMRWMWILFVATIVIASITRGCKELADTIAFFKIVKIIFDSVFYALAVNVILQPFLRNFFNFSKSFYGDESYLTHTLPVSKNQLINSKFLTTLIEIVLGFACLVISVLIMFASPTMLKTLKIILSTIILDKFSVVGIIVLFVALVIVEFLMFISIIYFAIVVAYRDKEKRVLKTFLITMAMAFIALTVLSVVEVVILMINGIELSSSTLTLSSSAFIGLLVAGIVVYSMATIIFYFITKKEFNKGVNVD